VSEYPTADWLNARAESEVWQTMEGSSFVPLDLWDEAIVALRAAEQSLRAAVEAFDQGHLVVAEAAVRSWAEGRPLAVAHDPEYPEEGGVIVPAEMKPVMVVRPDDVDAWRDEHERGDEDQWSM